MNLVLRKNGDDYTLIRTVDELEYVVDGELSKENCDDIFGDNKLNTIANNKDKQFTLEELRLLIRKVHVLPGHELEYFEDENNVLNISAFINHFLGRQSEVEVEFEVVKFKSHDGFDFIKPYHDSSGRIILKKKII